MPTAFEPEYSEPLAGALYDSPSADIPESRWPKNVILLSMPK